MPVESDQELLEENQNQVNLKDSTEALTQGSDGQKSSSWIWIFLGAVSPLLLGLVGFGIYTAVTPKPVPVNIIVQAPSPSPVNSPSSSNTPSPVTEKDALSPIPSSTGTISPTPNLSVSTISPEDLVRKYYGNIKSGQYQDSWNMLPSGMQKDQSLHPNGYGSFRDWWTKTNADIDATQLASQSEQEAVVNVDVRYTVNRGSLRRSHLRYFFTKDPVSNSWTISKIKLQ
jgi:serine/threonine protein kinase, bacterial